MKRSTYTVMLADYFEVEADNPGEALDRALASQRGGRIENVALVGNKREVNGRTVTGREVDPHG